MNITTLQIKLVIEMKEQGVDKQTINGIMLDLETEQQQQKMLNYLISIREKTITKSTLIKKALEISEQM